MANRKGQAETPSFTVGLVIMVLMIVALGVVGYAMSKKNVDVRTKIAFDDFLTYYKNCSEKKSNDCHCGKLDVSMLPRGYWIMIAELGGDNIGFELYKEGEKDPKISATAPGLKVCKYTYSGGKYNVLPLEEFVIGRVGSFFDTVMIYKTDQGNCFVLPDEHEFRAKSSDELFNVITSSKVSCDSKKEDEQLAQLGLVHMREHGSGILSEGFSLNSLKHQDNAYQMNLKIASRLRDELTNNVGRVYSILLSATHPLNANEDTRKGINEVYSFLENKPEGRLYIISTAVTESDKEAPDGIILEYLKDSTEGKRLAQAIQNELQKINGKFYYERQLLPDISDKRLLLNFHIESKEALPYEHEFKAFYPFNYPIKERNKIPVVFLDFVERNNGNSLLENHYDIIADSIVNGAKSYLLGEELKEESKDNNEPLFDNPQTI